MKTNKLTVNEHKKLGRELKFLNRYSTNLYCVLSNAYGKTSRVCKVAGKFEEAIRELKDAMENKCFRDHPDDATLDLYYGMLEVGECFEHLAVSPTIKNAVFSIAIEK